MKGITSCVEYSKKYCYKEEERIAIIECLKNHKNILDEPCLNELSKLHESISCKDKHSIEIAPKTHNVVWSSNGPCKNDIERYCIDFLPASRCFGFFCNKDYYVCLSEKKTLLEKGCKSYLEYISTYINELERMCKKEMVIFCGVVNSQEMIACASLRFLDFSTKCRDIISKWQQLCFCI